MSAGEIWWGRLGNSLRFLSGVSSLLRESRSAIVRLPERFPWREQFDREVDRGQERYSLHRRLVRVLWREGEDPGTFVLGELCPRNVQAEYWPGQTVAEYLGALDGLELGDCCVWVRGIHSRNDVIRWADFASRYETAAAGLEHRACFLLEYDGPAHQSALLPDIAYEMDEYDSRALCLELSADLAGTPCRGYLTELAIRIGREDPELCAALLARGDALARDPEAVAEEVLRTGRNAGGNPFAPIGTGEIASAVWRAAVVLLFPVLEGFRFAFIERHQEELARYLPITNSNGDQVTEPADLELGSLFFVVTTAMYVFSPADVERIRLCRGVRNELAHNKPVPYEDVLAVLSLQS